MTAVIPHPTIHYDRVSRAVLLINSFVALAYMTWWFLPGQMGNAWLYSLLVAGEMYHVFMALSFWQTIWPTKRRPARASVAVLHRFAPAVDIFITVAGEPTEVVRQTALAARDLDYPNHKVYLLNDGKVANKPTWPEIDALAQELGIACITRDIPGGAKAGNINNALKQTEGELVVVFDADMVADPSFLRKTVPFFADATVGFVQTPQYYANRDLNQVTGGSWEQQELFFGPIMHGKNGHNAAFICGTNVVLRRSALLEVGGMVEDNIAEDFLTSLRIHQNGWQSHYLTEVLATGLAPEDLLSYYKQQLRWARGSLEVLFGSNPLLKRRLKWGQKLQYLVSALYYFNGVIVLIDMMMPLVYLFFHLQPVVTTSTSFALFFAPFMFVSLYTLYIASGMSLTFRAMSFSQASWTLQLSALKSVLLKQKMAFAVTPKQAQEGNFLRLAYPHLGYIALGIIGIGIALHREGLSASLMANISWVVFNAVMFLPFIAASYRWSNLWRFGRRPVTAPEGGLV